VTDGTNYYHYSTYYSELKDGSMGGHGQSAPKLTLGKNIGRANETTPKEQAIFEVNSTVKRQMDEGYHEIGKTSTKLTLPMLAHKFADKAHTIKYPVWVQPKYDGMRMLTDGHRGWSRKGIEMIPEVVAHIFPIETLGYVLDGELLLPPPALLQETMAAAKKFRESSRNLYYSVFDVVAPDKTFSERMKILRDVEEENIFSSSVKLAPSWLAKDEDEIMEHHERFVKEGWEGTMIRTDSLGYEINQRSNQLLKLKDFQEEEFEVVNIVPGKVEHIGGILVCKTKDGKEFNVTPKFPHEQRVHWLEHPEEVVGKMWSVRFQAYSADGIPIFGRGVGERIEDLQG
jgi:DNA ligase 1